MMFEKLSESDKKILLKLARQSIILAVGGKPLPHLDLSLYSPVLQSDGASFVTLTEGGELRGCIGTLEPYQPLVQDVCEHAVAAALHDYRFPPLQPSEIPLIKIEISRLTLPQPVRYENPLDLPSLLRPNIDGVTLRDGFRRATFLPQVWEKIPEPYDFLGHLCQKMGAPSDLWQKKVLSVSIYQVEEFREEE
ncbi:MAG: AmmeMemoRadiSam system protein A [Anaerolineae bacterium]|nr:AmmeMemoRadiSam system protein A [Anaerolineae bacterium]